MAQHEAQVKLDQAQIDNAKAILDYTTIVAPIDGRTGIRQVDQGNIVRASDASGIVVITQLQPISVLFTLPQQQLGEVNRAFAAGALPVDAFGPDNKTVVETGELKVVDNQVDSDDRHDQAQGRISQSRIAALAGRIRQRAAADRHAQAGGGGADRGGAARAERHLRLCRAARQQGGGAAGHGVAAG